MIARICLTLVLSTCLGWAGVFHFQFGSEVTDLVLDGKGGFYFCGTAENASQIGLDEDGQELSFVAHLGPDLAIKKVKSFPRATVVPSKIVVSPTGKVLVGGTHKREGAVDGWKKSDALVMCLSADLETVGWERPGGPNQNKLTGLAVSKTGIPYYTGGTRGRGMGTYVMRCAPDGTDSLWQEAARDWCLDLHHNDPQLNQEGQYWHFYKINKDEGGYDYDGPEGKWGKVRFSIHGIRQGGQTLILPDGDLVVSGTNQYDFREGKNKRFPAFDFLLARYSPEGKLKWSTNLYLPGDSVHTPDQKAVDLAYDAKNDQLLCLVKQHGSNVYRFDGKLYGDTGNLMISWLGRVSAKEGKLASGWYFQNSRQGNFEENGIPKSPPYPKLSGNSLNRVLVDAEGRSYLCGSAGAKMWTTPNALHPWPEEGNSGQQACLVILEPDHKTVSYASTYPIGGNWNSMAFWGRQDALVMAGKGRVNEETMASKALPISAPDATGLILIQQRP